MPSKKRSKRPDPSKTKRNLVARAGARTSAGPMKIKDKLSRQQQALRDKEEALRALDSD